MVGVRGLGIGRMAWALIALTACGDSSAPPVASRTKATYAVVIDLGVPIAQLGAEEDADVDEAVGRLVSVGDAAVPVLEAAVANEPQRIGLGAIEALGQIGSPRAIAALIDVSGKHPDVEVRATALLKLGESGSPSARPVLEMALTAPEDMVSQTAAVACGALCASPAAIDRIVDLGLRGMPDVELGRLRATLVALLAGADASAAAHARETILAKTAPILRGTGPLDERCRAALLAADAGATDVEPTLIATLQDSASLTLRVTAAQWLGQRGTTAAVTALRGALQDRTTRVAAAMALQGLAQRGVPGAREIVANLGSPEGGKDPPPRASRP